VAQIKSTLTNSASSNISDRDANGNLALARSIAVGAGKLNVQSAVAFHSDLGARQRFLRIVSGGWVPHVPSGLRTPDLQPPGVQLMFASEIPFGASVTYSRPRSPSAGSVAEVAVALERRGPPAGPVRRCDCGFGWSRSCCRFPTFSCRRW